MNIIKISIIVLFVFVSSLSNAGEISNNVKKIIDDNISKQKTSTDAINENIDRLSDALKPIEIPLGVRIPQSTIIPPNQTQ